MKASRRRAVAVVLGIGMLLAAGAARASRDIVLPRPGQVGIEIQGGYGALLKSGELGEDFSDGATIAARLRYRMRYERALGLTFENQRFNIRAPEVDWPAGSGLPGRDHVNVVLSGLEFYKLFGTRTPTVRMLIFGGGLAQTSGKTVNNEGFFPGDGTYLCTGFGVERFLMKSWALDFSTRYSFVFLPEDHVHDVQVSLGLMFYASY
jgi:hypothetical protein